MCWKKIKARCTLFQPIMELSQQTWNLGECQKYDARNQHFGLPAAFLGAFEPIGGFVGLGLILEASY